MAVNTLDVWDYVVVAITMCCSIVIGLYFKYKDGKNLTSENFLLASKSMSLLPVIISLMSTFTSGITVLGNSAETYTNGFIYIVLVAGYFAATPLITYGFMPVFYKLDISSTYEYLELRFGPKIRTLISLSYGIQMLFYNGIVIYAPALAVEAVTGLDTYISIILVGVVSTIYSTIGGMKAVIWTDLLQSSLMFISIILVIVFGTIEVGGLSNVIKYAQEGSRLDFLSWSLDPTIRHSMWSLFFGGFFLKLILFGVNHTQVVRYKSLPTLQMAKWSPWMSLGLITFSMLISCFSGIVLYAVYRYCDPLSAGSISSYDQILPYYVMEYISYIPGIAGLFVSGLLSASLSTISSACNGLTSVLVYDFLSKWMKPSVILSKIIVVVFSVIFMALAFIAGRFGGIVQASATLFGVFGGPVLGVFTMGMTTIFNNEIGALFGFLTGLSLNLWISFGGPRPPISVLPFSTDNCNNTWSLISEAITSGSDYFYMYKISYQYLSMIGFICTFVVGSIASLSWRTIQPWERKGDGQPDPTLFFPCLFNLGQTKTDKIIISSKL